MLKKENHPFSFVLLTGVPAVILVLLFFASFMIGTYPIPASTVWDVLRSSFMQVTPYWESAAEKVIFQVRIPRIRSARSAQSARKACAVPAITSTQKEKSVMKKEP